MGARDWLDQLERDYASGNEGRLTKRLAGWRATGDVAVLTFALLKEIRALRETLEGFQQDNEVGPR